MVIASISYTDAAFPVREDFGASHTRYWQRLARPGAWWGGAERVAIAAEVRGARNCDFCRRIAESLSPAITGQHDCKLSADLPAPAVDAVHRLVNDANRLSRAWFDGIVEAGLTPERYVELLGTVVAVLSIDGFARGIGVARRALPEPVPGEPTGYRPARLELDQAWVRMVPADNAETAEADLWPAGVNAYVIRAMSLVPDEVRSLADLSAAHYLSLEQMVDLAKGAGVLSRPQTELIAGRVSALNQCYY